MIILFYILLGLGVGLASGLVGTGGGVLLVPALLLIFGDDHRKAVGTTLAIMVPPIGLLAALEYYRRGEVDLQAAAVIAVCFILGAWGGGKLAQHVDIQLMRFLFGLLLVYVAARFLLSSDREVAAAYLGLVAVAFAWLAYIGLRILGRRHVSRPDLGEKIRSVQRPEQGGDYHI